MHTQVLHSLICTSSFLHAGGVARFTRAFRLDAPCEVAAHCLRVQSHSPPSQRHKLQSIL